MRLFPATADANAKRLIFARGLRALADGYVSILLPAYLLALGLDSFEVGVLATATLMGSASLTLCVGLVTSRFGHRGPLLAAAGLMVATGCAFAGVQSFWPLGLEQKEFADVPAISVEDVRAMIDSGTSVQIIDARPRHYTTRSHEIMEGAVWRDPERLDEWIGEISKEQPVVTYCVYGFHIGCQTAITLRKAGYDARYMAGGHYAWKAAGGKVRLLEE